MAHTVKIASLEEELARLKRGKKRKALSNPNKRFMTLSEALASGEAITEKGSERKDVVLKALRSSSSSRHIRRSGELAT